MQGRFFVSPHEHSTKQLKKQRNNATVSKNATNDAFLYQSGRHLFFFCAFQLNQIEADKNNFIFIQSIQYCIKRPRFVLKIASFSVLLDAPMVI
jgi:hypothetical protein